MEWKPSVDQAIAGDTDELFELLRAQGGTDRGEVNMEVATAFAREVASRGAAGDALIERMATMSRVAAPEGSAEEFLTLAGIVAHGERAAQDWDHVDALVTALGRATLDKRARVHAAAVAALVRAGEAHGQKLLVDRICAYLKTSPIDNFVVAALADERWLSRFDAPEPLVTKLDQIFRQLAETPPGFDSLAHSVRLMKHLETVPARFAGKFPDAMVVFLKSWHGAPNDKLKRVARVISATLAALDPSLAARVSG